MSKREVEEKYLDVLQNIEAAIYSVYSENPDLTDWDVIRAIEMLTNEYKADVRGRAHPVNNLKPLAQQLHDTVAEMCEKRMIPTIVEQVEEKKLLGILPVNKKSNIVLEPKTKDEIIICLKRIQASAQFWTKEHGRQGYLEFISNFMK